MDAVYPLVKRNNDNVVDLTKRRNRASQQLLEQLFKAHGVVLGGFLARRKVPPEEIDDVTQDIFVRLAKIDNLADKLLPEPAAQRSFLFTMANNMLIDRLRRKRVRDSHLAREVEDAQADFRRPQNSPESLLSTAEDIARVKAAISAMKPAWRQAFVLSRFKYFTYGQIAEDMNVSVKQVEKYMKNALIRIRDAVADDTGRRK